MSLTIVKTTQERLVGAAVTGALRAGLEACGSVLLFVPSFAQALDAQHDLAREAGLSLGVQATTPAAWVRERWELWGDGRTIADETVLTVLARDVFVQAPAEVLGSLELSPGLVNVLKGLVGALPWLPLHDDGTVRVDACAAAGLTDAETQLMGLAGRLRALLAERGFVSAAEASVLVPTLLAQSETQLPPVVIAGFSRMSRSERKLVHALAGITQVSLVAQVFDGPASEQVRALVAQLAQDALIVDGPAQASEDMPTRTRELTWLRSVLFTGVQQDQVAEGSVELLLPAGPVAEAELVARRVAQLAGEPGTKQLVVATPDVPRARRELVPKLAARGLSVRYSLTRPLLDCPSAQVFFAFAQSVALLSELDATWPAPVQSPEGPVARLGDMNWWPPRELADFLLSDVAHVDAAQAWWTDAVWRGNRLLAPARLLAMLQSEKDSSPAVAKATAELLRGRMGTAASKLLLPYVEHLGAGEDNDEHAGEARAALQAILQLGGALRELGVTADPSAKGALPLSQLIELALWAAQGMRVVIRSEAPSGKEGILPFFPAQVQELRLVDAVGKKGSIPSFPHASSSLNAQGQTTAELPLVRLMSVGAAARLAPASVDALVVCGLTGAEQRVSAGDDLLQALLTSTGVEPADNPMARARADFHALMGVARKHVVLERALHDSDSKPTYPSVMLSEVLAAYGASASSASDGPVLPTASLPETLLADNLSASGAGRGLGLPADPAPAGRLTEQARSFVFVPQDGSDWTAGSKPVLSASQIETYLDCPYKWFSLRRLRLGTVDAGHGGMEMGTFAHRVLEVTHRELLARALEVQYPGVAREDLLAGIEADPACHVSGSRIDAAGLEAARAVLGQEFDLHQQHMYMVRRPKLNQQLLVAHNAAERAQEDQLKEDLLSSLAYQTNILQGFEPRLFEWSFGRHGQLVEYAGAYFTGTVDRIDVSPHGTAVIIDYKHKNPAGFAAEYDALQDGVLEGEQLPNRVQSLIYAQVVRRAFEGRLRLVGSVYLSTKSPHALAGVADDNVADLVFGRISSAREPRVCVPRTAEGDSGMNALLDRTEELVAEQVREMLAGNVEARPRDVHSCDFCPVMQCERRVVR